MNRIGVTRYVNVIWKSASGVGMEATAWTIWKCGARREIKEGDGEGGGGGGGGSENSNPNRRTVKEAVEISASRRSIELGLSVSE